MQEDEVRQLLCDAVWLLLSVRETVELNEGLRLRVRVGDVEEEGEALVEGVPHGVGENVTEAVSESDKRAGEAEEERLLPSPLAGEGEGVVESEGEAVLPPSGAGEAVALGQGDTVGEGQKVCEELWHGDAVGVAQGEADWLTLPLTEDEWVSVGQEVGERVREEAGQGLGDAEEVPHWEWVPESL